MFVAGIGVGPTFAVFTLIVQNSVPVERLGAATSNLTFFQSVGGTIGLAITGTIFGTTLAEEAPRQLASANLPPELTAAAGSGFHPEAATAVGDLGAAILAQVPEAFRAQVEAVHPGDRRRDPSGRVDRDGQHVRDRRRGIAPRGTARDGPQGGPDACRGVGCWWRSTTGARVR
jgi:MFS family permease